MTLCCGARFLVAEFFVFNSFHYLKFPFLLPIKLSNDVFTPCSFISTNNLTKEGRSHTGKKRKKTAYQLVFSFDFLLPKVCLVKIWGAALHKASALGHYATLHRQSSMWHSVFMHQSFVSTYGDSSGIAGLRCRAISRFCCPHSAGVITLGHLPRWEFLLCRAGQRAGL